MKARLYCPAGKLKGRSLMILNEAVIGRGSPNSPEVLAISDDRVSGKHARIYWAERDTCFYIEDLGSTNGTTVAGRRLTGPERLDTLDVVNFGGAADFVFQVLASEASPHESAKTVLDASGSFPLPEVPTEVLELDEPLPSILKTDPDRTRRQNTMPQVPNLGAATDDRTIFEPNPPALPNLRPADDPTIQE